MNKENDRQNSRVLPLLATLCLGFAGMDSTPAQPVSVSILSDNDGISVSWPTGLDLVQPQKSTNPTAEGWRDFGPPTTASILADSVGAEMAIYRLRFLAPVITVPPQSQNTPVGEAVEFSVSAVGTAPLGYQWWKGNSQLNGANAATLNLSAVTHDDEGEYAVVITNRAGGATSVVASLTVTMSNPPGMVLVAAGPFTMGNALDPEEGYSKELPQHTVQVSSFYVDRYEVTKALWDDIYHWAVTNGYSFDFSDSGRGKAASHPAHSMTWFDAVKWCNARSEKEGRVPAYYTDVNLTQRYRDGQVVPSVNWASGFRLPTEAEWEKAARGGVGGRRFPWSDTDTITHSRANYFSREDYPYDVSSTRGFIAAYNDGVSPYTSPVGSFPANGYGLFDMAGNVEEWCWDFYLDSYYSISPSSDPRGPVSGVSRVARGGGETLAFFCRVSHRGGGGPIFRYYWRGFRSVLSAGQ